MSKLKTHKAVNTSWLLYRHTVHSFIQSIWLLGLLFSIMSFILESGCCTYSSITKGRGQNASQSWHSNFLRTNRDLCTGSVLSAAKGSLFHLSTIMCGEKRHTHFAGLSSEANVFPLGLSLLPCWAGWMCKWEVSAKLALWVITHFPLSRRWFNFIWEF